MIQNFNETMNVFYSELESRHSSSTQVNDKKVEKPFIFKLWLEITDYDEDIIQKSSVYFVDLARFENSKETKSDYSAIQKTIAINKSLNELKNDIKSAKKGLKSH